MGSMKPLKDPLAIALNFINYRLRSVAEIEKKLRAKNIDEAEIEKTIEVLKKNQLLDDQRLAVSWIRQRALFHPSGKYLVNQELKKLGVVKEDVEKAWEKIAGDDDVSFDEVDLAVEAGRGKLSVYRRLDEELWWRRMMGFLQRRGFRYETIKKALAILDAER